MDPDKDKEVGAATVRSFVIGVLLSGLFAWLTVILDNADPSADPASYVSGNLIPALPHVMLLLAGILVNPVLRRLKIIREFCKAELLLIFVMTVVSAGLATWGLNGKLIPEISALSNPEWNTDQSQWDIQVMPFVNEKYFIAEEGSQEAAQRLRDVHTEYEVARKLYQAARDLKLGEAELAKVEARLKEISLMPDSEEKKITQRTMVWPHTQSVKLVETATAKWEKVGAGHDPQEIVATYSGKIAKLKSERDRLRDELKDLNKGAFEAVEEIRKGLPPEKRAFPGFFYSSGEGLASYSARFKRLRVGRESRAKLEDADAALADAIENAAELPADWGAYLTEASGILEDIADIPALSKRDKKLTAELEELEDRIADQKVESRRLRQMRRYSKQSQFESYNDRIDELDASSAELQLEANSLRDVIEKQVRPLLDVCERVKKTQSDLLAMGEESESASIDAYPGLRERLQAIIAFYPSFDASARRYWFGDAKWRIWLRPVCNWLLLAFIGYVVLMSFNVLIFRQWAHNEKLIYPLAEVASIAAGGGNADGSDKPLFKSGLFWTGFAIAAGILGWNYLAKNNIVPNINPVSLESGWWSYFGKSIFSGLNATYFSIIFVVIGVSFLVPSSISFSIWFFEIINMLLVLVMVWMGYGYNRQSVGSAYRHEMGTGAMLVFGVVILFTCRKYLLCAFRPRVLKDLAEDEAKELRVSSVLFLSGSAVLLGIMTFGLGANPLLAIVFFLITLTVIIALIRVVAEGGILGVEGIGTGLATIKTLTGASKVWGTVSAMAPLGVFMGLLFGGTKAFIAPIMANSLKIREQIRIRRLHFHGAIWAGIAVAALISAITLVIISYDRGADNLHGWLNSDSAKSSIEGMKQPVIDNSQPDKPSDRRWLFTGIILMSALLLARRRFFGVPHPIGMLMMVNMSMLGFWGSVLLGWMFKSIVSKYCTHEQYISIRRFFVGLILGHLLAILLGWDNIDFHWG